MNGNDELAAFRARFPNWDIMRIFGGYRAVPKGTPVVEAVYLDDELADRLSDLDDAQRWQWVVSLGVARRENPLACLPGTLTGQTARNPAPMALGAGFRFSRAAASLALSHPCVPLQGCFFVRTGEAGSAQSATGEGGPIENCAEALRCSAESQLRLYRVPQSDDARAHQLIINRELRKHRFESFQPAL